MPKAYAELICWQQVLNASDTLSKYLQSGSIDVTTAPNLIEGFKERMLKLRSNENFEEIKNAAHSSSERFGINENFIPSRKFPTIDDFERYLKWKTFYTLHDRLQAELETRFEDFSATCALFSVLDPKNYYKDGNDERLRNLCYYIYANDIDLMSVLFEYPALMCTLHGIFKNGQDMPKSNA